MSPQLRFHLHVVRLGLVEPPQDGQALLVRGRSPCDITEVGRAAWVSLNVADLAVGNAQVQQ